MENAIQNRYEQKLILTPDYCNAVSQMSPLAPFTIFQGLASIHAEQIGVGGAAMTRRGEFWLTVHCRVDFFGQARLMDELTAVTWPEACSERAFRCFRSYTLHHGEQLLALGRTQWAILGPGNKLMQFGQTGFPSDFPFYDKVGITDSPTRFTDDFTQEDYLRTYTVRATDIDMGQHMNNVAYVRVLLDCFSASTLADDSIASIEVHYAAQCREKEPLALYRKDEDGVSRLAIKKEDGKPAFFAAVRFRPGER